MELKNIRRLLTEEDAVTPVIGIILVVAITVILAAVVGVYGLGIGDQVQDAPPNADFDFTYDQSSPPTEVTIEHNGAQPIQSDNIEVVVSGSSGVGPAPGEDFPAEITSGDTAVYEFDNPSAAAGETLRIVWTAPNGESSNTIGQSQVPD